MRFRMQTLRRLGVEAHALFLRDYGGGRSFEGFDGEVFFGASEKGFVDLVRSNRYDLISIIDSFDVLDWIKRMEFEGRVLVELRSTYEHTLAQLKRLADHSIDGILVPSEFQRQHIRQYLPAGVVEKVSHFVASNFVDLETFRPRSFPGLRPGPRVVCWIGRIDPLKNWQEFLSIADRLAERPDVEFWMAGGGRSKPEARTEFRKALEHTRACGKLRWWPLLSSEQMPLLYSLVAHSGGLVLLTTKCESFGFAVLETLACQCPIVAPAVGAIPEIVEDGLSGLLYKLGDIDAAAQRVTDLLDNNQRRQELAAHGLRSAQQRFSPESCISQFARVIRTLVESNGGPGVARAASMSAEELKPAVTTTAVTREVDTTRNSLHVIRPLQVSEPWHFDEPGRKGILLRWQLTHWCNFDCSYCCSRITTRLDPSKVSSVQRVNIDGPFDLERTLPARLPAERVTGHAFSNYTVEEWCAGLHQRFKGKRLALTLNGGEPFWDLTNMCRFLWEVAGWDHVDNIRVDTNASWTPPLWFRGERLAKVNLNAAWHPTQMPLDRFAEKLQTYKEHGLRLTMVNFVMQADQVELYERLVDRVSPLGVPVNPSVYIPTLDEKPTHQRSAAEIAMYRRFLTDFDILYRSGDGKTRGKACRYPTVAYMMDVAGELAVACHGNRRGHLFAGPLPERLEGWATCPKDACICVDMYSFLEEAPPARVATMNTLAEYAADAISATAKTDRSSCQMLELP